MIVDIVVDQSFDHHVSHAHALRLGFEAHGVASRIVDIPRQPESDVVACWGWRIAAPLVAAGKRVLVMEHGYIGDRKVWTSLGWNGLNGRAAFPQAGGPERFAQHHAGMLKPWNPVGNYSLLVGQVDGDASLHGMPFQPWAVRMAHRAEKEFGLPVKFRPHPVALEFGQNYPVGCAETIRGALADAIAGAAVVITFNSNTAVEATLAGKPCITFDQGSMAWPVSSHGWSIPLEPNRQTWANDLAWKQWTMEEIRNGSAWEYVRG